MPQPIHHSKSRLMPIRRRDGSNSKRFGDSRLRLFDLLGQVAEGGGISGRGANKKASGFHQARDTILPQRPGLIGCWNGASGMGSLAVINLSLVRN
jgi:hypothetical protein